MPRTSVFDMRFARVYLLLLAKAERKGRTRAETDAVIAWLTGYDAEQIDDLLDKEVSYGDFLRVAPVWQPRAELITGKVCGVQVETIADPLMKRLRQLDKLVDELAKGWPLEKILR